MVEPPARREIIVVYTWWRVVEAMLRGAGLSIVAGDHGGVDPDAGGGGGGGGGGGTTRRPRSTFTAEALAAAGLVGIAAGCCQPWS